MSYTILTITSCRSECCVSSGLDFEAAGDSVVRYFVSNYLLRGLRVAVNTMWVLFRGQMRKQSKEQEIWPKVGGGCSFVSGPSSRDYGTLRGNNSLKLPQILVSRNIPLQFG